MYTMESYKADFESNPPKLSNTKQINLINNILPKKNKVLTKFRIAKHKT